MEPCFDDFRVSDYCVHWAETGACEDDSYYMRKRCARTCKFCEWSDELHAKFNAAGIMDQ